MDSQNSLHKGRNFIEEFRKLDPNIPAQQVVLFLHIADSEGVSARELANQVGMSQSSLLRNMAALGERHGLGKKGLDIVRAEKAPEDTRERIFKLTPKGRSLVATLEELP